MSCMFCEIAAGRSPASVVYADEEILAFLDVRPMNPGHTLVIPRVHAAGLGDLDPRLGGRTFQVAQQVAGALRASDLRCDGVNLFLADGEVAFQEVFHAHLHVVPRFTGDGLRIAIDWSARPDRAELDRIAVGLRSATAGGPTP